jgi:hypothetical protein
MAKMQSNPPITRDPALGVPGPAPGSEFGVQPLAPYNAGGHPPDGSNPSIPMPPFPPTK